MTWIVGLQQKGREDVLPTPAAQKREALQKRSGEGEPAERRHTVLASAFPPEGGRGFAAVPTLEVPTLEVSTCATLEFDHLSELVLYSISSSCVVNTLPRPVPFGEFLRQPIGQ